MGSSEGNCSGHMSVHKGTDDRPLVDLKVLVSGLSLLLSFLQGSWSAFLFSQEVPSAMGKSSVLMRHNNTV